MALHLNCFYRHSHFIFMKITSKINPITKLISNRNNSSRYLFFIRSLCIIQFFYKSSLSQNLLSFPYDLLVNTFPLISLFKAHTTNTLCNLLKKNKESTLFYFEFHCLSLIRILMSQTDFSKHLYLGLQVPGASMLIL